MRVGLLVDAIDAPHGVASTIERIRAHGVPGCEVEVIGTDRGVDRRLPAATDLDVPFYEGMRVGIPELPSLVEAISEGRYDLLHPATPGPSGATAALIARMTGTPLLGSHHTELVDYARLRSGSDSLASTTALAMSLFYGECEVVLSPSTAADRTLAALGVEGERIARWIRGVDTDLFAPTHPPLPEARHGDQINVLYAGRLTREKGMDLLADAFTIARHRIPSLRLLLAGDGPERDQLLERVGEGAEWLGWLSGDRLAGAYAAADAFVFPSETDTYGQVVVEAQASGLPVIAVRRGGPADLIEHGRNGLLAEPEAIELAAKLVRVIESEPLRQRLIRGGIATAAERSWAGALAQLGDGYRLAVERARVGKGRAPGAAAVYS